MPLLTRLLDTVHPEVEKLTTCINITITMPTIIDHDTIYSYLPLPPHTVHPEVEKQHPSLVDTTISKLHYGSIVINAAGCAVAHAKELLLQSCY